MMTFAETLRALRRSRGLTQQELADLAGITALQVLHYENNEAEPKLTALRGLVTALQCDADALVFGMSDSTAGSALQNQLTAIEALPPSAQAKVKETLAALMAWYMRSQI